MDSVLPIPDWNEEGFLPPNLPPTWFSSPYVASHAQFQERFCTTPRRRELFQGFLAYEAELRRLGFGRGFHWIGGSFVEDVERVEGRPPSDIDTVSFLNFPKVPNDVFSFEELSQRHTWLSNRDLAKARFLCDSTILPISPETRMFNNEAHIANIAQWTLLFSRHQKTSRIKGIIRLAFPDSL